MRLDQTHSADRLAYRVPEFARASGLSRSYVYQVIKEGGLRLTKVGRASLILREDAVAFLRDRRDRAEA